MPNSAWAYWGGGQFLIRCNWLSLAGTMSQCGSCEIDERLTTPRVATINCCQGSRDVPRARKVVDVTIPVDFNVTYYVGKSLRFPELAERQKNAVWIAWWDCYAVPGDQYRPGLKIRLAFRELSGNSLSEQMYHFDLDVALLWCFQIGTIWRDGVNIGKRVFDVKHCKVSFFEKDWAFGSFEMCRKENLPAPFSRIEYPAYHADSNWMVEFDCQGRRLIIPSVVLFRGWYGRDKFFKEQITSLPYDMVISRVFASTSPIITNSEIRVITKTRLNNNDLVFATHLLLDPITKKAVSALYGSVLNCRRTEKPTFLKAGPWFEGLANMKVEGVPIQGGRGFLVLNINGISDPVGPKIVAEFPDDAFEASQGRSEGDEYIRKFIFTIPPSNIECLTGIQPGRSSPNIAVKTPGPSKLGTPRSVERVYPNRVKGDARLDTIHSPTDQFSTQNPNESEGEIGRLQAEVGASTEKVAPHWEVWRALNYLAHLFPEKVNSVKWYTPKEGFSSNKPVTLCELWVSKDEDAKLSPHPNWLLIDDWCAPAKDESREKRCRGVLVVLAKVDRRCIWFIEIEREVRRSLDGGSNIEFDKFSGLVFELVEMANCKNVVTAIISLLAAKRGVFKNVLPSTSNAIEALQEQLTEEKGQFCTYQHYSPEGEQLPGLHNVLAAFEKVGIVFPRIQSKPTEEWMRSVF